MKQSNVYFWATVFTLLNLTNLTTYAQDKNWNFNGSFGFGYSSISNMPADIYQQGNENIQLGILIERTIGNRFSFVSLIEYDILSYSFDGYISSLGDNKVKLELAGPDIKYGGINQRTIAASLLARAYLKHKTFDDTECLDGSCLKSGSLFLQGGLRIAGTTDFTNLNFFQSRYHYRENGEGHSLVLSDFVNRSLLQFELSVGVKGRYNNLWSILNSSTVGFIYQFTPILKRDNESVPLNPIHLSWRFFF